MTRLDERVLAEGLAADLREARGRIMRGDVLVRDKPVTKPGTRVRERDAVRLRSAARRQRFASRGGDKLDGALEDLGVDVAGLRVLDVGAATGGFTDCVLQRGAEAVVAVDVGYGLLADALRRDPRVTTLERTNVRDLSVEALPFPPDLIVVDASFIGLTGLLPTLAALAGGDGRMLLMVKPQFELPRALVPTGGVVRDPALRREASDRVSAAAAALGWITLGVVDSRVAGPRGNVERFVWLGPEAP